MRCMCILVLVCLAAPATIVSAQSLQDRFDQLNREYESSMAAWHEEYDDAKGNVESIARYRDWPGWMFAPRFVAFGESAGSSSEGFESLCELLNMGNSVGEFDRELFRHYERAIERLLANHWGEKLRPLCHQVRVSHGSEAFLRTLMNESESEETRAEACYCLGRLLAKKRDMCFRNASTVRPTFDAFAKYTYERSKENLDEFVRNADVDHLYVEAERCFHRVEADYPNVVTVQGGEFLGGLAKRELFELKYLSIGGIAPQIEGRDLSGNSMALSDFRGKVVLLVFWASWCGPCMGDVPHEKELHSRFAGRPFAIVGINADETLELANKAVDENAIPWRSFRNGQGDAKGAITEEWNVRRWPTVYVIDHLGVIRHKHLRRKELDAPLERLVHAAETDN